MISEMLKVKDGCIRRLLARSSKVVSVEKLAPLRQNRAGGKQCDIDGQSDRASVWENASQCEELAAIFLPC
jgi:hypothetical protein